MGETNDMAANLKAVSPSIRQQNSQTLATIINGINQLDEDKRRLLSMLPNLDDEQVTQARMSARALGVWAWVIECACDAEILRRVEARRGRGNKDIEEQGRVAAVNKHAYQCGLTPATIYRNAQIYNRFQNVLNDQNILEDKGFYEAALRAPEPEKAIEAFAEKKDKNAFFSVRDAHREAEKLNKSATPKRTPPQPSPELQKIHDDAVRAELESRLVVVRGWTEAADPILAKVYRRIEELLEWQRDRDRDSDCAAIMLPVNKYGVIPEEDLPGWLDDHGYFMSKADLESRLDYMCSDDAKKLSKTDAGKAGKQDERRGKLPQVYVKWFKNWGKHYEQYKVASEDDDS
jgi:hypothetical protein